MKADSLSTMTTMISNLPTTTVVVGDAGMVVVVDMVVEEAAEAEIITMDVAEKATGVEDAAAAVEINLKEQQIMLETTIPMQMGIGSLIMIMEMETKTTPNSYWTTLIT